MLLFLRPRLCLPNILLRGTMEAVLAIVFVLCTVALNGQMVNATTVSHPHRHQRLKHLQETIDRLVLRQRTDHILIDNLQKAVKDAQEGSGWSSRSLREVEEERRLLAHLTEGMDQVKDNVHMVLQEQQHSYQILLLRQEIAQLRSEVKRLQESRESDNKRSNGHTSTQQQREAVTSAWMVDNVQRLQDSVMELQEAFNVTTALHDKQEVESRVGALSKDLEALRGSLGGITSKAETAAATVTVLQKELARISQDSHHSAGKIATLDMEVSAVQEDFNNLLMALPEGTVARGFGQQGKTKEASSGKEAEHQLQTRVKVVETGMAEMQTSSIQLLSSLDALEARVENELSQMRQEMAKLEYKVTASQDKTRT